MVNEGYSFSQEDPIRLGIPVTRHFDNGKTRPAKPPDVPTNPDRSCTYLVLRETSDETSYEQNQTSSCPEVAPQSTRFGPTLRGALARGVKIKMTLGQAYPRERKG